MILTKRKKFKETTEIEINGQIIKQIKCTKFLGLNMDEECTLSERSYWSSWKKDIENDRNYGKGETSSIYPIVKCIHT